VASAEETRFTPEGFLRWLNTYRPVGKPELTKVPLTVEGEAEAAERTFRQRAAWWAGDGG
jgi:hypothetical protein